MAVAVAIAMTGESITCSDCGGVFVFTDPERAFFASKGLVAPKRCKDCRAMRKSSPPRTASAWNPARRPSTASGGARSDRPRWEAVCTSCGARASVPFEPRPGREVLCSRCWRDRDGIHEAGVDAVDVDAARDEGEPAIIE